MSQSIVSYIHKSLLTRRLSHCLILPKKFSVRWAKVMLGRLKQNSCWQHLTISILFVLNSFMKNLLMTKSIEAIYYFGQVVRTRLMHCLCLSLSQTSVSQKPSSIRVRELLTAVTTPPLSQVAAPQKTTPACRNVRSGFHSASRPTAGLHAGGRREASCN